MDERVYWLWLVLVFGPAEKRLWACGKDYDDVQEYYKAVCGGRVQGLLRHEAERSRSVTLENAEKIIDDCEKNGIEVIGYDSREYPERLRSIPNPPAVLFLKGDKATLSYSLSVGIAGTRSPSDYSKTVTASVTKAMGDYGCTVISGLSEGVDILANSIASDNGYNTIGVYAMPIEQFQVDEQSSECRAVISESCEAMNGPRVSYSMRNRIIAGLCDAVIFVEGSAASKGLNVCEHFISLGKAVFVVPPHDINDRRYLGQSWLMRRGCHVYLSANDVLYYLSHMGVERIGYDLRNDEYNEAEDYSFYADEAPVKERRKLKQASAAAESDIETAETEENEDIAAAPEHEADISGLDEKAKEVYLILKGSALMADELAERIDVDIDKALSILTMMELEGFVISLPGKRFRSI